MLAESTAALRLFISAMLQYCSTGKVHTIGEIKTAVLYCPALKQTEIKFTTNQGILQTNNWSASMHTSGAILSIGGQNAESENTQEFQKGLTEIHPKGFHIQMCS